MQSILIYGGSSSGKTTEAGEFAKHQAERLDAPVLYVNADNDAGSAADAVSSGALIPLDLHSAEFPLYTIRRISRGYWPHGLKDGHWPNRRDFGKIEDFFPVRSRGYRIGGIVLEGLTRFGDLLGNTLKNEMAIDQGEPIVGKFRMKSDGSVLQGKALDAPETNDEESRYGMDKLQVAHSVPCSSTPSITSPD